MTKKTEKEETVNGYKIKYNGFWKQYQVSHKEIGANIAAFKKKSEAVDYCKRG